MHRARASCEDEEGGRALKGLERSGLNEREKEREDGKRSERAGGFRRGSKASGAEKQNADLVPRRVHQRSE